MHFITKLLVGAAAFCSTSVLASDLPAADLDAHLDLEARAYYKDVDRCQQDIKQSYGYQFCKTFLPPKTVVVKKTVYKYKGTRTICSTKTARCTQAHGKREAEANPKAVAEAEPDYNTCQQVKCNRQGVPYSLQKKYSCEVIQKACFEHYQPKTSTQIVRNAISSNSVQKLTALRYSSPPAPSTSRRRLFTRPRL